MLYETSLLWFPFFALRLCCLETILQIFWQSLVLSFAEIRAAKLRSFLSLLGITIGIICIISVRTAVNSLEMNVQNSFASLGNDILYIQKWPWIWTEDYAWWKYVNRPVSNRRELEQLQLRTKGAKASCILFIEGGRTAIAGDQSVEGISLVGASYDYNQIKTMDFTQGRYFTASESNNAAPVALVGAAVAETLFGNRSNIEGEEIKVSGIKVRIIGVLKKEGSDLFGFSLDNNIIVPFTYMSMFANMNRGNDPLIAVIPKKGVPVEELKYELRGVMRSIRRLSPFTEDNFAVNQVSVFTEGIASIFSFINGVGLLIGIFSIIVGGFGIANIMFVAVKERTYIIGIKKAIGAKKVYILMEFLLEAVVLCVTGGVIGLIVVVLLITGLQYLITNVAENDFKFYITAYNLVLGVSISVIVGIVAGFIPAWSASKMRPVDAIRS